MGAAVFIATVAAGVRVCRGDRVADAFYSLCIPQPRKPGAQTPVLVSGSFLCLLVFTDNPLFCSKETET